jgi:hypothetical protein
VPEEREKRAEVYFRSFLYHLKLGGRERLLVITGSIDH